jgi:glucosamine-6-phosphate deaminase
VTRVETLRTAAETAVRAAERIAALLVRRPSATLVLASGKTMIPVYRDLARLAERGRAPFARARTFNLDELAVHPGDPRSFRSFMERWLFARVGVDRSRIHFLRGDAAEPETECARYEAELAAAGPVDLALVGIGGNGHVAYLEPGSYLPPRTSPVRLSASTRRSLAADGMRPVPSSALTMGIETILSARSILLVATGASKSRALAEALEGPVTPQCPASFLTLHPELTVVIDRAAGSSRVGAKGVRRRARGEAVSRRAPRRPSPRRGIRSPRR